MSSIEDGYCWPLNPRQIRELETAATKRSIAAGENSRSSSGYLRTLEINEAYAAIHPSNCAVRERTADGVYVGVCTFYLKNGTDCPRHGRVKADNGADDRPAPAKEEGDIIQKCDICFEAHETEECAFNREHEPGLSAGDGSIDPLARRTDVADWQRVARALADALDKQCPVSNAHLALKDAALKAYYQLSSSSGGELCKT